MIAGSRKSCEKSNLNNFTTIEYIIIQMNNIYIYILSKYCFNI